MLIKCQMSVYRGVNGMLMESWSSASIDSRQQMPFVHMILISLIFKKKVKPAFLSNLLWYTTVMSHCDWKLKSHDISKRVTRKHWPPVRRRVCKRGPWTGPWSSPWTGAVGGSMDWGSVFSGHPTEGLHLEKMKKSSKRNFSFSPFQCLTPKPMTCICS